MKLLGKEISLKEFDTFMVAQSHGKQLKLIDDKIVAVDPEPHIMTTEEKINELKQKLSETDYQAIKFAEGILSEEEYKETKEKRQEWRKEINRLEEENK